VHISAVIHWQSPKLKPFLLPCTLYLVFGTLSLDLRHFSKFLQLPVSSCNSVNRVSQSESRIQIILQLDWMARFSLLQPDVSRTWKTLYTHKPWLLCFYFSPTCSIQLIALHPLSCRWWATINSLDPHPMTRSPPRWVAISMATVTT